MIDFSDTGDRPSSTEQRLRTASPTNSRSTCRRNWWTTSLTSFTTTQGLSYERLSCPGHCSVALAHISASHWKSPAPNFSPRALPTFHHSSDTLRRFTLRGSMLPPTRPQPRIAWSSLSHTLSPFIPANYTASVNKLYDDPWQNFLVRR